MKKPAKTIVFFLALACFGQGQTVDFELKTYAESPVVFAAEGGALAPGVPRRQFVTLKSECKKSASGVILQQTVTNGSKTEIVAIEHVGIIILPGEKKRVSIAVSDVAGKLQSGEAHQRPVLSVVAVEFVDGSQWNAPTPKTDVN